MKVALNEAQLEALDGRSKEMYLAALAGQEAAAYWRRGGGMGTCSPTTKVLRLPMRIDV